METNEIRIKTLLSIQRALLGAIYPAIRVISVNFQGLDKITINCFLDREPNNDDYENISIVTGEVCADIPFKSAEEKCICFTDNLNSLSSIGIWVYMRKENFEDFPNLLA